MSLEIPFTPIGELVQGHARTQPDAPAVTVEGHTLSWAQLAARASQVAASLQREGLTVGSAIAIISYTNTDYVALYLGALMAGVAVAPMPPSATPEQLKAMVTDSGAPLLFLDTANAEALAHIAFSARTAPGRIMRWQRELEAMRRDGSLERIRQRWLPRAERF